LWPSIFLKDSYFRYITQGVDAKVELKWSDPIGADTEINPKGFTQLK